MLSLLLTSADIIHVISRMFVNWPDPTIHMICPSRKSLICRTSVKSNCLKLWYWQRQRGGGGQGPRTSPWKISSCHLFLRRKTGTNFPREAIPLPPPRWSCLDPHTYVWRWNFIFYFHFLHVTGLAIKLSRANCLCWCTGWSAPLLFACNKVELLATRYK